MIFKHYHLHEAAKIFCYFESEVWFVIDNGILQLIIQIMIIECGWSAKRTPESVKNFNCRFPINLFIHKVSSAN